MHDTVKLEERGIPAVALVHDRFEAAAHSQAKILGLATTRVVSIPEPHLGEPATELSIRIDHAWSDIIGALVKK
ncbi:hypothetical protein ACFLYL_04000 [Chloroflexota bacterium]